MQPNLLWPGQRRLLEERKAQAIAVVAGAGYGKTLFGVRATHNTVILNPRSKQFMVVAETSSLLTDVILPMFQEFYDAIGFREGVHYKINRSPDSMRITYCTGQVIFLRSGQTWKKLGTTYSLAWFWVDECARQPDGIQVELRRRLRCPKANFLQALYTGYGEGLGWFYDMFGEHLIIREEGSRHGESEDGSKLVLFGRSDDNPFLPQLFLDNLFADYQHDPNLMRIYYYGGFAPILKNGAFDFSEENLTDIGPDPETRVLHLTWDFNVGQVYWGAAQQFGSQHVVVAEVPEKTRDTEMACLKFIDKFPPVVWGKHHVVVTGDASGWGESTKSSTSDYDIIYQNLKPHYPRLSIVAPRFNPSVMPSIVATNRQLVRKQLKINRRCSWTISSLRTTQFDGKGKLAKPTGDHWTHPSEGVRYLVELVAPAEVRRPVVLQR